MTHTDYHKAQRPRVRVRRRRDRARGGDARGPHAAVRMPQRRVRHVQGRILEGTVDYGPHQASTLTEDEKRTGLALFCCARPQTDLVIEVREVRRAGDIQIKRLPCRIESIDKRRARRRDRALQAAGERAAAVPRRPVHRLPAEGRQAAQLLAGHAAARRRSCSNCTSGTCPAASSPTCCSRNTRGARSCASRVRSARSTCARNPTSR